MKLELIKLRKNNNLENLIGFGSLILIILINLIAYQFNFLTINFFLISFCLFLALHFLKVYVLETLFKGEIDLNEKSIRITTKKDELSFELKDLQEFCVYVQGFDHEIKGVNYKTIISTDNGSNNYVEFSKENLKYHFDFYIGNKKAKTQLFQILNRINNNNNAAPK